MQAWQQPNRVDHNRTDDLVTDTTNDGFTTNQIRMARRYLSGLLKDLAKNAAGVAKEQAVELAAVSLESLPVPVLNRTLAETVRRTFGKQKNGRPSDPDGLLDVLEQMQQSDEGFASGMSQIGLDLGVVAADVAAMRQLLTNQSLADFQVLNPELKLDWPIGDNTITALLANVGGGSVIVHEVHLDIEVAEPYPMVDYSVPAAPLNILHLQAELTVSRTIYPLLEMNEAAERIFNERGDGAERLVIDLTSRENARYRARLRFSCTDLIGQRSLEFYHPPEGDSPLVLPFVYAPGWRRIDPQVVLERVEVMDDLQSVLSGVLEMLRRGHENSDDREKFARDTENRLAVEPGLFSVPMMFRSFVTTFATAYTELAALERRTESLEIVLPIVELLPTHIEEPFEVSDMPIEFTDAVATLSGISGT